MNNPLTPYALVIVCVLALSAGQIIFKAVSMRINSLFDLPSDAVAAGLFIGAMFLYGASTLIWVVALKTIPLSKAYPFMALGFILVPIAAHYVFSEKLSFNHLVGLALVVLGLIVASR